MTRLWFLSRSEASRATSNWPLTTAHHNQPTTLDVLYPNRNNVPTFYWDNQKPTEVVFGTPFSIKHLTEEHHIRPVSVAVV